MKALIYILLFNISAISFAQDPQLFENTWYLQKVVIDGVDYFPPSNSELETVNLEFVDHSNFYSMATYACSLISADVNDIDNQVIDIYDFYIIDGNCTLPETIAFEDLYFNDFYNWTVPDQIFGYVIESGAGNTEMLTLTNQQGDTAIYGNYLLAVENVDVPKFSLYPNPVKDKLFLTSTNNSIKLKIKIFNIAGKLLSTQNFKFEKQASIDVSQLATGIYFLNIQDENGNTEMKKIIKE